MDYELFSARPAPMPACGLACFLAVLRLRPALLPLPAIAPSPARVTIGWYRRSTKALIPVLLWVGAVPISPLRQVAHGLESLRTLHPSSRASAACLPHLDLCLEQPPDLRHGILLYSPRPLPVEDSQPLLPSPSGAPS